MSILEKGSEVIGVFVVHDFFDLFDVKRGAQSLLKALRMHKSGDVVGAKAEIAWITEKIFSLDIFLIELFDQVGDKELAKLTPVLHSLTGKKFHSRLLQRLIAKRKYISTGALIDHMDYVGIKGQMMAPVLEEIGIVSYFEVLSQFRAQGTEIKQLNAVFYASTIARLSDNEFREFVRRHLELGFPLGQSCDVPVTELLNGVAPDFTMADIESEDWLARLYLTPPAQARRDLASLIWRYLESESEGLREEIYNHFANLSRDRYENSIELVVPLMGKSAQSRELLLDLMDIYLESHDRISFTEGFSFCIAACEVLSQTELNSYIDDLVEVVEAQREEREVTLAPVNRFTVPAIFNRYRFKSSAQAVFAFKVFDRLSYSALPPAFFMRSLQVFEPELMTDELRALSAEIEYEFIGLSRLTVLKSIAESKPASEWIEKAREFIAGGYTLSSREWSTGVDAAVRTKNRELYEYAMENYCQAPDAEPAYFVFHSSRYLIIWGEPSEWAAVLTKFEDMRAEQGITGKNYLEPWMPVWMVRNAAERWMPALEDFIEKYMFRQGAIDSKVLSVLCEKYRVAKQTEEIRRVIGRFGSRVKGEGDWSLLVLARAYYEVRLPDMGFAQLEDIATRPVTQEIRRRIRSFGVRFNDPRIFELFQIS